MKDEYDLENMKARKNPYASRLTGSESVRLVADTGVTILNQTGKRERRSGVKSCREIQSEMQQLESQLIRAKKRECQMALRED